MMDGLCNISVHDQLMVFGAETLRHHARVLRFIELLIVEGDGERLYRRRTVPRHECNHDRGIHAAAQERAERHIRNQANTHCFFQPGFELAQTLFFTGRLVGPIGRDIPILLDGA